MAKGNWGPWEHQSPIGEGGAGHVFHVRHSEKGTEGALKRLKNPKRHTRFKSEVEAVAKLSSTGALFAAAAGVA
jgi:serine/threonine protein kinase